MVVPYKIWFFFRVTHILRHCVPYLRPGMRTRTQQQQRRGESRKERMRASDAKYEMYSKGEGGENLMEPKTLTLLT